MADAADLVRAVRADHPDLHVVALAPNFRGARNAAAAGAQSIILPVSASEAHSRSNVRKSRDDQVGEVERTVAWVRDLGEARPRIEGGISTAFGCSLQGAVPEDEVVALTASLARAGVDSVGLADTLGYASPSAVRRLVRKLVAEADVLIEYFRPGAMDKLGLSTPPYPASCSAASHEPLPSMRTGRRTRN